jgi:hypothetical protein
MKSFRLKQKIEPDEYFGHFFLFRKYLSLFQFMTKKKV